MTGAAGLKPRQLNATQASTATPKKSGPDGAAFLHFTDGPAIVGSVLSHYVLVRYIKILFL